MFTTYIDEFGDFMPPLVGDVGTIFIDEMYQYDTTEPDVVDFTIGDTYDDFPIGHTHAFVDHAFYGDGCGGGGYEMVGAARTIRLSRAGKWPW